MNTKPEIRHFDVCVIGSGPGGQKAAIRAAKLGRSVCVVERMESVGGVAIHTGTIPSKALREAIIQATADTDPLSSRDKALGQEITMESLLLSCQRIIQTTIEIVRKQLGRNGVSVIAGQARFIDSKTVYVEGAVEEVTLTADSFVIATGTVPCRPESVAFDEEYIVTSDDLIKLKRIPASMIVLGGGVIGTEYASMFSRLGVRVTLVDRGSRLLSFLDSQIGEALQYHLRDNGMTLLLNENFSGVSLIDSSETSTGKKVLVDLESGKSLKADMLLYCMGRNGAVDDLGLEHLQLSADKRGRLSVDSDYRTSNRSVFAVGDVIGFPSLASTSMDQGRVAASVICESCTSSTSNIFPYGIYSIPEISMVGSTEDELTADAVPFETGIAHYRETARGQIIGDETGILKLLVHSTERTILGVHIIGTGATELIHIGQAVMVQNGSVEYFADTAFNYPTLAECYKMAALNVLNKLSQQEKSR